MLHRLGIYHLFLVLLFPIGLSAESAVPLTQSKITEIVKDVSILRGEELKAVPAVENQIFKAPDFLQTGRRSRARMEAEDGTITRVGSNTLFSFDQQERSINLKQGSVLFHSPEGRGGGRVVTASATASVLGTTIAVVATPDGGFKLLVIEGTAQVNYPDGTSRLLNAGQMTFVLPSQDPAGSLPGAPAGAGNKRPGRKGPVLNFDLERMTKEAALLNGFSSPIPSEGKIEQATNAQRRRLGDGFLRRTKARIIRAKEDETIVLDITEDQKLRETVSDTQLNPGLEKLKAAIQTDVTSTS